MSQWNEAQLPHLADILMAAAGADQETLATETSVVRKILKELQGAKVSSEIDARVRTFSPKGFDLAAAAAGLGKLDESMGQASFLEEMFSSQAGFTLGKKLPPHLAAPSAEAEAPALTYLKALLAWKVSTNGEGLTLFERAIGGQFELGVRIPHSLDFYTVLNPGRVTNIAKVLLGSVGGEPRLSTEAPSPMLSKCMRALELLGKYVPAMLEAQLLSARCVTKE